MARPFRPTNAREFRQAGNWFRDRQGRYAMFRGVNFGGRSKLPPYLPVAPLDLRALDAAGVDRYHAELTSVLPELDRMRRLGFNVVRLPLIWKAIEPTPNPNLEQLLPEGRQYLGLAKELIDTLYARGMSVLLDFHQDIAHDVYGGDGFPDWAMAIDTDHPRPPAADLKNKFWQALYCDNPLAPWYKLDDLVRFTLRSFWLNKLTNTEWGLAGFPVQTHLVKTIGQTAAFFKDHPAVLGYEPFNEPHQVGLARRDFEERILPTYYRDVLTEISRFDATAFVFVQPRSDWTIYAGDGPDCDLTNFTHHPNTFFNTAAIGPNQARLVFAFHYYDPWMLSPQFIKNMHDKVREWPPFFAEMRDAATARRLIPFLTEFGASQDWQDDTDLRPTVYQRRVVRAAMDLQFQQVEAKLLNSTYWVYDLYNTPHDHDNWNLENLSLLGPGRSPRHHDIVARPYPLVSSGPPRLLFFDIESKHAALILQGPLIDAATVLYVPRETHYPAGFEVRATSPGVLWDKDHQLLTWLPNPAQQLNQLILHPAGAFTPAALPAESRSLLTSTLPRTLSPAPSVEIAAVAFDPAGPDLPGEQVTIRNTGGTPRSLQRWRLQGMDATPGTPIVTYTFPAFTLAAGASVRVWTKRGTNNAGNLYWNRAVPVWPNTGGIAILRENRGVEVDRYRYPTYAIPPIPGPGPGPGPKQLIVDQTITVPENRADVDTGIDLAPNDDYAFEAGGDIWAGVIFTGRNGPAGWDNVDHDPKFPLHEGPDAHPFCLIGKFGATGTYFYIGNGLGRRTFVDQLSRRLFLRTNDDSPGNGNGAFTCRVLVWR